jgi:hypothetical protein
MIYMLAQTVYNAEALTKVSKDKVDSNIHDHYIFGVVGNAELSDAIRDYNLINVSYDGSRSIILSASARSFVYLVSEMSKSKDTAHRTFAQYFSGAFPSLFGRMVSTNGTLVPR